VASSYDAAFAILHGDLVKGGIARGGKYYKRIPKGGGRKGYRYFYTKASYEKHMGKHHDGEGNAKKHAASKPTPTASHAGTSVDARRDKEAKEKERATREPPGDGSKDVGLGWFVRDGKKVFRQAGGTIGGIPADEHDEHYEDWSGDAIDWEDGYDG
jgi:hypothetical protein|tara:strand:- start:468 stop:938 length:471 start_codon:yes stop_codon:yes gene_type:complete